MKMNKKMAGLFISIMMMMISLSSGSSASKALGVYEVKRGNFSAKFTNWGATLISLLVPDRYGMSYSYPARAEHSVIGFRSKL